MVNGHAERRADGVLAAVALADGVLRIVLAVEIVLEIVHHLLSLLRQAVFVNQRQHGHLDRGKRRRDAQHDAGFAVLKLLDLVGMAQHCEEHTVHTDGSLHAVRNVALVGLRVEVLDLLSGESLMVAEVEVGTGVDSLQLLETEREVELDVGRGVGVVGQFLVIVETVVLGTHPEVDVPFHAVLLPLFEPLHLGARTAEEFHLHLLELSHSEYELSCDDLVSERLSDLGDTERNLHAARLLDVEIFNEYSLCRLRTQVDLVVRLAGVADLGREHQVELTHVGPVLRAGNRIHNVAVKDDLLVLLEVVGLLGCNITVVNLVIFRLLPQNVRVSGAELLLVEGISEPLAALLDLLVHLLLDLAEIVLDQIVGAIPLLGVLVVDERIVERRHVA